MENKSVILAIDDSVQQLSEFKSMLIPAYDLRVVKSASEAISFLNKSKADLILLDIEMPNVSGFEFLNDIRKIPSYIVTPIIIVSGNSSQAFLEKAKTSTASDVLIKPVRPEVLIESINKNMKDAAKSEAEFQ